MKPHLSPRNRAGQEMVPKALLSEKQGELNVREDAIQVSSKAKSLTQACHAADNSVLSYIYHCHYILFFAEMKDADLPGI